MSDQNGMNLEAIMAEAQAMQEKLREAQERQDGIKLQGTAADGAVLIEATGNGEFVNVVLSEAVSTMAPDQLAIFVLEALQDVVARVEKVQMEAFGDFSLPMDNQDG